MSSKHIYETFRTYLTQVSPEKVARVVSYGERMPAEHRAGLIR